MDIYLKYEHQEKKTRELVWMLKHKLTTVFIAKVNYYARC